MRHFLTVLCSLLLYGSAHAAVIPIGPFTGSTVITFTGLADLTEVNGLSTDGVTFSYTIGGVPTDGDVIIDEGPGMTNQITPPNIVTIGDDSGVLGLLLPAAVTQFGYGYAVSSVLVVPDATTIALFMNTTNVGSLSFTGNPDPLFAGGFAGVQSTIPFNRVELTFNSAAAQAFAVDNITFGNPSGLVPEPSSAALMAVALLALWPLRKIRLQ